MDDTEVVRADSGHGSSTELAWQVIDAAPDGIIVADAAGDIVLANRQTLELFGYERAELVGQPIEVLVPERLRQIHQAHRAEYRAEPRTRPMASGLELRGLRRDGREIPIEISLSPLPCSAGFLVVACIRDIADRVEIEARLQQAREEVRLFEDRDRIARDLHDKVIQRLFAAGMSMQAAIGKVSAYDSETAVRMETIVDELDETIREIRSAIYQLRPHGAQSGVRHRILRVIEDQTTALRTEPHLTMNGVIDAIPDEIADHLMAVLREALSNVARHAQASRVDVTVEAGSDVTLRVVDDGVGMPDDAAAGHGLRNMADRAEDLGGALRIDGNAEGGTAVEWRVPNHAP